MSCEKVEARPVWRMRRRKRRRKEAAAATATAAAEEEEREGRTEEGWVGGWERVEEKRTYPR